MSTNLLLNIVEFVGALCALIIIHEFGHFIMCRLLKVEVEEFGLGFPPHLLTLFQWRGTKFTLNALPLGGFVRPKGENDPEVPGGLAAASPWVRLAVYVTGPLSNLLVAILLYAIIFSRLGLPITNQVLILDVSPNSPASSVGLLPGDLILKVNNQIIDSTTALHDAIYANLDQSMALEYQRNGQSAQVSLVPRSQPPEGQGAIGIVMGNPTRAISIAASLPLAAQTTYQQSLAILTFPVQLIRGQIAPEQGRLVGIKGMFDIYQEVASTEPTPSVPSGVNVLGFFAMITNTLGILNLLPIPALDGGQMLFVLPELILRRRIPAKYENTIRLVSFALLLILLIYVNVQDFINPIQLPK